MTTDQTQHLMQSALDGELSPAQQDELLEILQTDSEQAREYETQERIDNLLRYPPMERAPRRLAASIMARLAQAVLENQKIRSQLTEAQIQVAMQLVTVVTQPILVTVGYLMLNAQSDPKAFQRLLLPVVAMYMMLMDAMQVMLEEASKLYDEDPELAIALLSMMPTVLLGLVKEIIVIQDDVSDNAPS